MNKFLQLKHWQLFILFFGIPILLEMLPSGTLTNLSSQETFYIIPILNFWVALIFFGWFWALGTNLPKLLPEKVNLNLTLFKTFLIFPFVYALLLLIFVFNKIAIGQQPDTVLFAIIVPLHLSSMFCIFYCLRFIAKVLKSVEWQREAKLSDYVGEFFLIWFFPIGVWFIQPRINKIFVKQLLTEI